jgi:hypothetical protein
MYIQWKKYICAYSDKISKLGPKENVIFPQVLKIHFAKNSVNASGGVQILRTLREFDILKVHSKQFRHSGANFIKHLRPKFTD